MDLAQRKNADNKIISQRIRIPKTAELVAGQIRKAIIRGELKEGDSLQQEAQLIESFSVSRPTIREAFRILESENLISVSRGSRGGARVHRPRVDLVARHAGMALQAQGATLADVFNARLIIEPSVARLVAEKYHASAPAPLREVIKDEYATIDDPVIFSRNIGRFHQVLMEHSRNQTLVLLMSMLRGIIEKHFARVTASRQRSEPEYRRKTVLRGLKSHEKLVGLIEKRDGIEAEEHWRRHLENADQVWLKGYSATSLLDVLE